MSDRQDVQQLPEAAKEAMRHTPEAAKTTGAGISHALMADVVTKVPGEAEVQMGAGGGSPRTGGLGAQCGMTASQQDKEQALYRAARGGETPDGTIESLHLHSAHGDEGPGSRADKQLAEEVAHGHGTPPHGAYATPAVEDRPVKVNN